MTNEGKILMSIIRIKNYLSPYLEKNESLEIIKKICEVLSWAVGYLFEKTLGHNQFVLKLIENFKNGVFYARFEIA